MLHSAKPFEVVLPWDPAFDPYHPDADYDAFARSQDRVHLRVRPHRAPMVFHLRPLQHAWIAEHLAPLSGDETRAVMAFLMSVIRVERGTYRDGTTGDIEPPVVANAATLEELTGRVALWRPEHVEKLFHFQTVQHVGGVALMRAFFDSPWTSPPFHQLPTLRAGLSIYRAHLADEERRTAAAATNSATAAPAAPTSSSAPGGEPGDATATAPPTSDPPAAST